MNAITRTLGTGLAGLSLTAVVLAQAPALNLRTGLWEITSTSTVGGQMPAMDTSKMTPEQKARMDAAMKSVMGPHQTVRKSCMTKEKLANDDFMGRTGDVNCKQKLTTNTATMIDGSVTCTGEHQMNGQMHIEAPSPTGFTGTVKTTQTEGGRAMTVDIAMTGKWLAAACGDVK